MNTLWVSLLALILIALAIVVVFNLLQSRQNRLHDLQRERLAGGEPRVAKAAAPAAAEPAPQQPAPVGDGRPAGARIEPTFGPVSGADPAADDEPLDWSDTTAASDDPDAAEPVLIGDTRTPRDEPLPAAGAATADRSPMPASAAAPEPRDESHARPMLDSRLDCIVELSPSGPIGGERLVTVAGTLRRAGSKPLLIEADSGDGRWLAPQAGGSYRRIRIGVLLANRHGPLNAMEYSEFGNAVQALARQLGTDASLPEMAQVLEYARALDDACMQLDAQIGLNVETPTALSPAELAALATGLDMVERGNNRYARLGAGGDVLFSLSLGDRANLLTLLLDVPRAPQSARPWSQMLDCARQCAARSRGQLVDDAGRPLTEAAAAAVTRQLEQRYASLDEAGLAAGSAAALRVFN